MATRPCVGDNVQISARKRIALVTYALHCGGMETYLLSLAGALVDHGYEVHIITTVTKGEWFHRIASTGALGFHVAPRMPFKAVRLVQVGKYLAKGNYDVIFLNHALYAQATIGMLSDKTIVIPVLHNDVEDIYRVGCANYKAWNVAVAVSPKVRDTACHHVPDRPIICIPNGVEIPPDEVLSHRLSPERGLKLISVNRLDHGQKGVLFLPDILKRCLDRGLNATLTVIGDGADRDRLSDRIVRLGVAARAELLGSLPHDQIQFHLSISHAFLLPSFYEGLSIAAIEAMASGCVPIASKLVGVTDSYIHDGLNGFLVSVGDIEGFVDAATRLQIFPETWQTMSRAARAMIVEHFSMQQMTNAYIRLMNDCQDGLYPLARSRHNGLPLDISLIIPEFSFVRTRRMLSRCRSQIESRNISISK